MWCISLVCLSLSFAACTDPVLVPIALDGLVVLDEPDRAIVERDQEVFDSTPPIPDMERDMAPPSPDMTSVNPDMEVILVPDGGVPMGDSCDPRLRAPACAPGFVCLPIPGGRVNQGRCVEGDECSLIGESGCPEDTPYCHLRGRATECTQPGPREFGEVCRDEFNRSLPCAEGLVCNFSVCVPPCDPTLDPEAQCGRSKSCVDIGDQINSPGGFCGAIALCDLFTNTGCDMGQQCNFAVRPDGQEITYFCTPEGLVAEDQACEIGGASSATPEVSCGPGLVCIGAPGGDQYCRRFCDSGGYKLPCAEGQSCRESLSQGYGFEVRSLGVCVTNR